MSKPKEWCLLENGQVESCYYPNHKEPRPIRKHDGDWFILIGTFAHGTYIQRWAKIVKFSDNKEELLI